MSKRRGTSKRVRYVARGRVLFGARGDGGLLFAIVASGATVGGGMGIGGIIARNRNARQPASA